MEKLVIIAIGGNSLISDSQHMTVFDQYRAAGQTSQHIAGIVEAGYRVVITHGNGPQVGFILLRSEIAKEVLHQVPLDTCGADTQGAIGYQISQTLDNELRRRGLQKSVAAVKTSRGSASSDGRRRGTASNTPTRMRAAGAAKSR